MNSSSTKQDTVGKTVTIAMHAVAQLMIDRALPAPKAIRRPRTGDEALPIDLHADDIEAWVEATGADYTSTKTLDRLGVPPRYVAVSFTGRVPSSLGEVAVVLRIVQAIELPQRPLSLVPGGAA